MTLADLNDFLNAYFRTDRYPEAERGGFFRPYPLPPEGGSQVSFSEKRRTSFRGQGVRLGLALEPNPIMPDWIRENDLDALWLHRPWKLDLTSVPDDVPILFQHLPFDETLTMGFNEPLAAKLQLTQPEELGHKQADGYPPRAIGMLGAVPTRTAADWVRWAEAAFGGLEQVHEGRFAAISRVAVVGAMNEVLLREAAGRGAQLYLTGAYRRGAQRAVDETGLHVLAVGHERSERWGLHALGEVLRTQFPTIDVQTLK
jgi:putative NIF3 family GTP cyclohydrolase 1 type 2